VLQAFSAVFTLISALTVQGAAGRQMWCHAQTWAISPLLRYRFRHISWTLLSMD